MAPFDIISEPVRGHIAPPWFHSLSGIDRVRAWSTGLLPPPPSTHLTGSRCTHVGPGSAVCIMPASEMLAGPNGYIQSLSVVGDALLCALTTTAGPGQTLHVLSMSAFHFRPARTGMGNVLARARVISASSWFAYAEVSVEDSEGRQIAHCGGQAAYITLDPAPPPPPSPLVSAAQPVWPTPDPWQRSPGPVLSMAMLDKAGGLEAVRGIAAGTVQSPPLALLGLKPQIVGDGHISAAFPASQWFCGDTNHVSLGIIASVLNIGGWIGTWAIRRPDMSFAGLDAQFRFFRTVPADGQTLRLESRSVLSDGDQIIQETAIHDAAGALIARGNAMAVMIDGKRRRRNQRRISERAVCTILFTDIVDSTKAASTLGDQAWNELLDKHNEIARREIAQHTGTAVKSTGDGLLARFASPAQGLECARRLRDSLGSLGLQIRAGLHTGECEIMADDIIGHAVNLAARIQAAAKPGEALVSSTVRELVAGSAFQFEARGEHMLKGFDEPWRLWALK